MGINDPRAAPTASPCVGRCSHNVGDWICRGCGRSVEEVRDWNGYNDLQKMAIKARLKMHAAQRDIHADK